MTHRRVRHAPTASPALAGRLASWACGLLVLWACCDAAVPWACPSVFPSTAAAQDDDDMLGPQASPASPAGTRRAADPVPAPLPHPRRAAAAPDPSSPESAAMARRNGCGAPLRC
jgi:hypothetical protein